MKKAAIIGIILIALLIIFGLYFLIPLDMPYDPEIQESKTECSGENMDSFNFYFALRSNDLNACNKIQSPGRKEMCIARIKKDTSICANFETEETKQRCTAVILQNAAQCPEEDIWCKAYASKDVKYCDEVAEEAREECINEVKYNADYFLSKNLKQECNDEAYLEAALKNMKPEYCKQISDKETRNFCYTTVMS